MTQDLNKGIGANGISYNHLSLPTSVSINGTGNNGTITYIYDATGIKLQKQVDNTSESSLTTTEYCGNYIYEKQGSNAEILQFFNTAEGYVEPVLENGSAAISSFNYVYQYKDHLGNIRLSYTDADDDGSVSPAEIQEENNFYPFGLKHKGYNSGITGRDHKYGFGNKEEQDEVGLDWLDFGWRNYEVSLGRWMNIDPLAEKRYELTSYNYVQNSPMFRIDPDGLTDFTLDKRSGVVTQVGEANDEPDRILKTNRRGVIRRRSNGEAKVAIGDIEQGILSDGMNLREESNIIEVGGEGQPTEIGVETFALKLSDYVGKEIGGTYYTIDDAENTTHISLGSYINNGNRETRDHGSRALAGYVNTLEEFNRYTPTGIFHTHPSIGIKDVNDRIVPSDRDLDFRDANLANNPALEFFLITHPVNFGDPYPNKIPYTEGYQRRLR